MYITLHNPNKADNLLTMNYLLAKNINFVHQNGYFFLETVSLTTLESQGEILLDNIKLYSDQLRYALFTEDCHFQFKEVSSLFADYKREEYQCAKDWSIPKSRSIVGGDMISLYFTGPKITNPLDLIWQLGSSLHYREEYYNIFYDFIPLEKCQVYQITFRLSCTNLQGKVTEIRNTRDKVLNTKFTPMLLQKNNFSAIYNTFHDRYLKVEGERGSFMLHYTGAAIYLPLRQVELQQIQLLLSA